MTSNIAPHFLFMVGMKTKKIRLRHSKPFTFFYQTANQGMCSGRPSHWNIKVLVPRIYSNSFVRHVCYLMAIITDHPKNERYQGSILVLIALIRSATSQSKKDFSIKVCHGTC